MKRLAAGILLSILLFASCARDQSVDDRLLENADVVSAVPSVEEAEEYIGSYTPEENYVPGDITDTAGIRYTANIMAPAVEEGMFISRLCTWQSYKDEEGSRSGTAWITNIVNLETGNARYTCADPLCEHLKDHCPHVSINHVGYYNGMIYVLTNRYETEMKGNDLTHYVTDNIEALDPTTGEFSVLWSETYSLDSDIRTRIMRHEISSGKLICVVGTFYQDMESKTENRTEILHIFDLDTGTKLDSITIPQELTDANFGIVHMEGDTLWCRDDINGFYRTDLSFGSIETVGSEYAWVTLNSVDTQTGEIFLEVREDGMENGSIRIGRLNGNEIELLDMPHDNILEYQITRDWIYYTVYDPVPVGINHNGTGQVFFENGGKIYRTSRSDSSESELIFDDGVNFNLKEQWFVLGDCLYFSSWQRNSDGAGISFGRIVKTVRVNFVNHTVRYFRYE